MWIKIAQKVRTKCAKLVDGKKWSTVLLSYCSWFRAKNIIQRCSSYNYEKKSSIEKNKYCLSKKSKISICHRTMFNSVLNMRKIFSYSHLIIKPLSWNKTLKILGL